MYDFGIRHLARAFVDAFSIDTSQPVANELATKLGRDDLEVIIGYEQVGATPILRPLIRKRDESWRLLVTSESFDVSVHATKTNGGRLMSVEEFCKDSGKVLAICSDFFDRKARRLAAVQEGFLGDMTEEQMNEIARRLFKFPPIFEQQIPFEWDWRCASLVDRIFGAKRESANTLATIKRLAGSFGPVSPSGVTSDFDRIRVDLDVNTRDKDRATRFSAEEIVAFFDTAPTWIDDLTKQVSNHIFGSGRK